MHGPPGQVYGLQAAIAAEQASETRRGRHIHARTVEIREVGVARKPICQVCGSHIALRYYGGCVAADGGNLFPWQITVGGCRGCAGFRNDLVRRFLVISWHVVGTDGERSAAVLPPCVVVRESPGVHVWLPSVSGLVVYALGSAFRVLRIRITRHNIISGTEPISIGR